MQSLECVMQWAENLVIGCKWGNSRTKKKPNKQLINSQGLNAFWCFCIIKSVIEVNGISL